MTVKKILQVQNIEFAECVSIVDVAALLNLIDLSTVNNPILETPDAHYLLKNNVAFRVFKPGARPVILKANSFVASPDSYRAKVELDAKTLLDFAMKNEITLFMNEATHEYLLPSDTFLFAKVQQPKGEP